MARATPTSIEVRFSDEDRQLLRRLAAAIEATTQGREKSSPADTFADPREEVKRRLVEGGSIDLNSQPGMKEADVTRGAIPRQQGW